MEKTTTTTTTTTCGRGDEDHLPDAATTLNSSSSSSSKFGSFILLASVGKYLPTTRKTTSELALIMISSESESVSRSGSDESGSGGLWWSTTTGSNDILLPYWAVDQPDDYDDRVFKVDDDEGQLVFKLDSLGFPSRYKFCDFFRPIDIVGSCNGLVCLYDGIDRNEVSLWNPTNGQFKVLPKWITFEDDSDDYGPLPTLVAFGFDVETKDYKVVHLTGFRSVLRSISSLMLYGNNVAVSKCLCRVQVYSLSTDSWRLLEGITCLPGDPFKYPSEVVYLNGSCFFLAHFLHTKQQPCIPENDRFIISFDFTKEIITPMQLPYHHRDQELYLCCSGDKIAFFTGVYYAKDCDNNDTWINYQDFKFYPGICGERFNIWVLNEHGSNSVSNGSWTKLHSFRIERKRPCEWNLPRGISNDGKFALLETKNIIGVGTMKLYNLVANEVKKTFLSSSLVMSKAIAYKPSLISIIGGNGCSSKVIENGATRQHQKQQQGDSN